MSPPTISYTTCWDLTPPRRRQQAFRSQALVDGRVRGVELASGALKLRGVGVLRDHVELAGRLQVIDLARGPDSVVTIVGHPMLGEDLAELPPFLLAPDEADVPPALEQVAGVALCERLGRNGYASPAVVLGEALAMRVDRTRRGQVTSKGPAHAGLRVESAGPAARADEPDVGRPPSGPARPRPHPLRPL